MSTKPKQEIDIKSINRIDDLQPIKRRDPFMYYSIPGVRSAEVLMKDDTNVDTSNLGASGLKAKIRNCDWDQQYQEEESSQSTHKVARKTCISFECHPDLLLDDDSLFDDDLDDDDMAFDILAILAEQE